MPASLEHVLVWVWPGWSMSPAILRFQHQASLLFAQLLAAADRTSASEALLCALGGGPGTPGQEDWPLFSPHSGPQHFSLALSRPWTQPERRRLGWLLGSCTGTSGVRGHGDCGQAKRLTATHRPRGCGGQRRQPVSSAPAPLAQGGLGATEAGLPISLPPTRPPIGGPADI